MGAWKIATSGLIAGMATTGSGCVENGLSMTRQSARFFNTSVPIRPRKVRKGTPFCTAIRPAWIAGQVLSRSSISPRKTARMKQGAPPASPRLTALVSTVRTNPAPISMSSCSPAVGTQTRWRSRGPHRIKGRVIAMGTPA